MVVGALAVCGLFSAGEKMKVSPALVRFDPLRVGYFEKENYVAYYQKRWLKLLLVSMQMTREFFQLSPWQALVGAYLVARAEILAAPFPDNDIPTAEAYVRRFYALVKRIHDAGFDVEEAAHWEVNWWVVHRRLFAQEDNEALVEALIQLYVVTFGLSPEAARLPAEHRARGMLYSDQWVNAGKPDESPLLDQVEGELVASYRILKDVLVS
jgi:hypothetical protein